MKSRVKICFGVQVGSDSDKDNGFDGQVGRLYRAGCRQGFRECGESHL